MTELGIDVFDDSSAEIIGNTFQPAEGVSAVWVNWAGGSARVIDNVIEDPWQGVVVEHARSAHIEGNIITGAEFAGIHVIETDAVIRDNTISDSVDTGMSVQGHGISASGNTITGGRVGVLAAVPNGYPPGAPRFDTRSAVIDNVITDATHFGIVVVAADHLVTGNTVCAGREPLVLRDDATPELVDNDICEVGP